MHDSDSVDMLDPIYKLVEKSTSFFLFESFLLYNIVEKLTVLHILHDQE